MMPGMNRLGVSRKIEDEDARRKMRSILDELELPKDMGFILRTAGMDRTKRELQRDLIYLQRLWKVVAQRIKNDRAPCELYQESDLVIRTIRDVYSVGLRARSSSTTRRTAEKVRDFLAIAMPRSSAPVELYTGPRPLFHKYGIEQEIERINSRHVPLPSGGSLVIDSTEALVAIDVNSGRFREHDDAEETAFRTNIEAAEEIARQLAAARPGRPDRLRLHRHADGEAPPRRRAGPARRPQEAQGAGQVPAHEPVRHHRDDPPAHAAVDQAEHLPGLPALPRLGPGQERRVDDAGHHAAAAAGRPPRAGGEGVDARALEVAFQLQNRKRAILHRSRRTPACRSSSAATATSGWTSTSSSASIAAAA